MLRSAYPRSEFSRPFVCYRCLSTILPGFGNETQNVNSRRIRWRQDGSVFHLRSRRSFSTQSGQRSDLVPNLSSGSIEHQDPPLLDTQLIRHRIIERLRQWETENAPSFVPPPILIDDPPPGEIRNSLTRKGSAEFTVDPNLDDTNEDLDTMVFGRDDLVDVGNNRVFLRPGDLVELQNLDGLDRELGIYIGDFETQSQFYSMSGRWLHRSSRHVPFYVPHFVEPHELDELRPYLPASDIPRAMQDKLHSITQLVPRSLGQSLIHKLLDFWTQSDAVYQAHSVALDNAHAHVAYPTTFRHATLDEIASELLPGMTEKAKGSKLPYPALYAVHRSLLNAGVGFGTPGKRAIRASGSRFEIIPAKHMANIELVRDIVREHMESKFNTKSSTMPRRPNRLQRFVAKAQRCIDIGRQTRPYTRHGTVGPSSATPDDVNNGGSGQLTENFDNTDMQIIQFIESWAGLRYFKTFSPLNGTGAAILRAVARYDQNTYLAPSTAWVFLQEIGFMAPWQNRVAFDLRLENTGLRQLNGQATRSTRGFVADKLQDIRKDWGDLPVYCIDDSNAHEVDDGISIEVTDLPGQYWMHVHTADPGAHTNPTSEVAQYAAALGETIYMPHRVFNMLPSSFVQANLSLARDRPCLTYSAKMNSDGDILDYKVTPGIIRNVHHITPRVVEEAVLKSYPKRHNFHIVGPELPVKKKRCLVKGHELSDLDKANFRLIHAIGSAHSKKRATRGAITLRSLEPEVLVSIKERQVIKNGVPMSFGTDPSIKVLTRVIDDAVQLSASEEYFNLVIGPMLIAGEIAARWCKDRGIPVINRITPRNEDKIDPAEYFIKHVLPTRNKRGAFDLKEQLYFNILGAVQPSATPGPHISMGLEMFARCTSPLRRYPDLLLQWQVESALLEEAKLGHSLVGNKNDDFLPFTKAHIESILPHVDARERLIAHGKRQAKRQWLLHFLLRAWKYSEAKIPSTFSFVVIHLENNKNWIGGELEHFQTFATLTRQDSTGLSELKVGDTLEVEIADVNIYDLALRVTPVRYLNPSERDALNRKNRLLMQSEEII